MFLDYYFFEKYDMIFFLALRDLAVCTKQKKSFFYEN